MTNGNPQIENGYTKIANELQEALAKAMAQGIITGKERAVVDWIIRYTYGFHEKNGYFHTSFIAKSLGLSMSWVSQILLSLEQKKIIIRGGIEIKINKHYLEWSKYLEPSKHYLEPSKQAKPEQPQIRTEVNGKKNHHKDNLLNITKDFSLKENSLNTLESSKQKEEVDLQRVAKVKGLVKGQEMQELIKSFCEEMGFQYGKASIKINVRPAKWLLENYELEQIMNAVKWQKSKIIKERKNPAIFIPNLVTVQKWIDNWRGGAEREREELEKQKKGGYII